MRKTIIAAGVLMCVTGAAFADECKEAKRYPVTSANWSSMAAAQALQSVLSGTPLVLRLQTNLDDFSIAADGVSGDLASVLDSLAEGAGFVWSQDKCNLFVRASTIAATAAIVEIPAPEPEQKAWEVLVNDRYVRVSLARWAKAAGFQLVWDVNRDIEISADSTFYGSFDEALLKVLRSLEVSDYPVEAEIYENRVIRIVKVARKD